MQIRNHHRRAIDRLADAYRDDPRFRGLIIGGSVAKGCAREDSDVDFLIIATDAAFERHRAASDLFINRVDLCDYDGGFVDGKIINLAFLSDLAEKGNEPSRAAFEGAFVAYSHVADLDALMQRIPVYPEVGHDDRLHIGCIRGQRRPGELQCGQGRHRLTHAQCGGRDVQIRRHLELCCPGREEPHVG